MGLTQLNFAGLNKVEVAIARLKEFEPLTKGEGFYFADSYGKDSCVCLRLLEMSKVKFEIHHSHTGLDAPELVKFGRKNHFGVIEEKPTITFWKALLSAHMRLPQRQQRWCCELLKEGGGGGRYVVTGIRWEESGRRAKRRIIEVCRRDKTKIFVNPIIDWTGKEVWEFIHSENIPYCSLYNEGFKRLGCVLCPMVGGRELRIQIERFPKQVEAWHRASLRLYDVMLSKHSVHWQSGEEMWQWWLSRKGEPKINDAQCMMFDN